MATALMEKPHTKTERKIARIEREGGNADVLGILKPKTNGSGNEALIRWAIFELYEPEHISTFYKQYVDMLSKSTKKWLAVKEANRMISIILRVDYEPSEGTVRNIPRNLWINCMNDAELSIIRR